MERRSFLRLVPLGGVVAVSLPALACSSDDADPDAGAPAGTGGGAGTSTSTTAAAAFAGYGPLGEPDANGVRLPEGFSSRILAETGQPVGASGFVWAPNPDGGAVFEDGDGWIYVVNSESFPGGVSMLRFGADGDVVDARSILDGSIGNCAGGKTPWGTWLTCEEIPTGIVYECDPAGERPAERREAMGVFKHEAAACDADREVIYETEDEPDGALYRFRPTTWGDVSAGTLEVLVEEGDALRWVEVPDPSAATTPTKDQVPGTKRFAGGEGADVVDGVLLFATKGDNRLWRLDPTGDDVAEVTVVWDSASATDEVIVDDVDNVLAGPGGLVYVAEDGPGLHLVVVGPDGSMWPVAQVTDTPGSEITGPAFSPDGTRLYFSSQRSPGRTYEITGPFIQA